MREEAQQARETLQQGATFTEWLSMRKGVDARRAMNKCKRGTGGTWEETWKLFVEYARERHPTPSNLSERGERGRGTTGTQAADARATRTTRNGRQDTTEKERQDRTEQNEPDQPGPDKTRRDETKRGRTRRDRNCKKIAEIGTCTP